MPGTQRQYGEVAGVQPDALTPDAHSSGGPHPGAPFSPRERPAVITDRIRERVESVIEGKGDVVRLALTVLLAEGHLLI